ncbi:MAG TPA: DedA family protein [Ilumatobacteraceae bacterium]
MIAVGLSPDSLLEAFGTIGLFTIVFVESGLLVGFFLPGDSLLFAAGLLASQDKLNYPLIMVGCAIAAILGDQVGYMIGRHFGPRLLAKERWFTRPHHVARATHFFDKRGGRAVVLARFVPIVRTFVPVIAGVVRMPYKRFVTWNIIGGILWGAGVVTLGYLLGQQFPWIEENLLLVAAIIVIASIVPIYRELRRPIEEPAAESRTEDQTAPAEQHGELPTEG